MHHAGPSAIAAPVWTRARTLGQMFFQIVVNLSCGTGLPAALVQKQSFFNLGAEAAGKARSKGLSGPGAAAGRMSIRPALTGDRWPTWPRAAQSFECQADEPPTTSPRQLVQIVDDNCRSLGNGGRLGQGICFHSLRLSPQLPRGSAFRGALSGNQTRRGQAPLPLQAQSGPALLSYQRLAGKVGDSGEGTRHGQWPGRWTRSGSCRVQSLSSAVPAASAAPATLAHQCPD